MSGESIVEAAEMVEFDVRRANEHGSRRIKYACILSMLADDEANRRSQNAPQRALVYPNSFHGPCR
jgi:hypothetical protein